MAPGVKAQKSTGKQILDKLPRLSTAVWLLIVSSVILIVAVPILLGYFSEISTQSLLKARLNQLQTRYSDIKKQTGAQDALLAEVSTLQAEVDKTRSAYSDAGSSIEISKDVIDLAWNYDITINNVTVIPTVDKFSEVEYPVIIYTIDMTGQVPAFQNFLLALGQRLPSSQVIRVLIEPAETQGLLDKATVDIEVVCNRP